MFGIAVLQATAHLGDVERNLRSIESAAERAAARGTALLITPELFATSYAPALVRDSDGESIRAELSRIARTQRIALVASSVDRAGGDRHISASLFDDTGVERTRYRKSHLFGPEEKAAFVAGGDIPEIVDFRGSRLALGICYDIEFAEFARNATSRGADLLCIPTAVPATGDIGGATPELTYNAERISTLMVPTRALENGVYVAYANHTAPGFTGFSTIASPYGTVLAAAGPNDDLLFATVDSAEVARARGINTYLDCLRRDLY